MRRISFSSRVLFLVVFGSALACASAEARRVKTHRAPREVRQVIDGLEEQFKTAFLNGDVAMMDRLLSDDYVGITWTGQVNTKASQLDRIRSRTLSVSRMEVSDRKVKLLGPVVIVTCASMIEGKNEGNPMSGTFRSTRVYQLLPNGIWKITNSESTRVPGHHGGRDGPPPPPPAP